MIAHNMIHASKKAYLIGIGGVGMSALARVLKHQGLSIAGSDLRKSRETRELEKSGIPVFLGQHEIGFKNPDFVIYSSAIDEDHLELQAARKRGIPVCHRAEVLSTLLNQAKTSVAIAGTHGKTTTASMLSFVLAEMKKDPTCLIGGDALNLGTNTVLGGSGLWISEVDESDRTHELYAPHYALITNLEEDHIDHYKDLEDLKASFKCFLSNACNPGLVAYLNEDKVLSELVQNSGRPSVSFGFSEAADFSAQKIKMTDFGSEFELHEAGFYVTRVKLSVPGRHNIANALAVLALLAQMGIDLEASAEVIQRFEGARRRLEVKWRSTSLVVIDDYAHHPTEVRASIRALRHLGKNLTIIFQPHRFSRTQYFAKQFGHALEEADEVIVTDIYSAGEANPDSVSSELIYQELESLKHPAAKLLSKQEVLEHLENRPSTKGIVAFLGAGDIGDLADEYASRFKSTKCY